MNIKHARQRDPWKAPARDTGAGWGDSTGELKNSKETQQQGQCETVNMHAVMRRPDENANREELQKHSEEQAQRGEATQHTQGQRQQKQQQQALEG